MATATSVFITYALLLGPRAPVRETRRSSSASDLTRYSRSRMACPKMDWGGTSRLPTLPSPSIDRTTYSRSSRRRPRVDRAPASFGPRCLAPLRARPPLGVSVGEQQSHYCDTEQNKTDRVHGLLPVGCCAIVADI